ncbi:XRE family transcriptional regulator, partial [Vibrio sp. 10N.222.54.A1]
GRHVPDIGTLERMAEELDVPLNYFFCRSELSAELACAIDKMSDEEKAVLLEKLASQ